MSTAGSPGPNPPQRAKPLGDEAAEAAQRLANVWFQGSFFGGLLNLYTDLIRRYPKAMGIVHLVVLGPLIGLVVIAMLCAMLFPPNDKQPTAPPAKPVFSSGNPLPVTVSFRASKVGKGVVIQLAGHPGSKPLPVHMHIKGTILSTAKEIVVLPDVITEIGWRELGDYIVRKGHRLTLSSPGYDDLVTTIGQLSNPNEGHAAASYYPLEPGARWQYRMAAAGETMRLTTRVAKIETIDGKPLARLETTADGVAEGIANEHLSSTAKGVFRHRYNGSDVIPPVCVLRYPVQVGDSWRQEVLCGGERASISCRVSGAEDIIVPAGAYRAFVVEVDGQTPDGTTKAVFWFARDAGIVKQTVTVEDELITFELEQFQGGK